MPKIIILFLIAFGLAGCSSTQMSDIKYKEFAFMGEAARLCHLNGHLNDSFYADSIASLRYNLSTYSFNEQTLNETYAQAVTFLSTQTLDAKKCKEFRSQLLLSMASTNEHKRKAKANADAWSAAAKALEDNAPTTTFCNNIGTMTTCTTY